MHVCEALLPIVVAPEVHHKWQLYTWANLLLIYYMQEFIMVGGYTEDLKKTTELSKLGSGRLPEEFTLVHTYNKSIS